MSQQIEPRGLSVAFENCLKLLLVELAGGSHRMAKLMQKNARSIAGYSTDSPAFLLRCRALLPNS